MLGGEGATYPPVYSIRDSYINIMPNYKKNTDNILFVHIPRTGGTSVEDWLKKNGCLLLHLNHQCGNLNQHAIPETYNEWGEFDLKFAVVRNPMKRFLSVLGFWGEGRGPAAPKPAAKDVNSLAIELLDEYDKDESTYHNHIRPQIDFLTDDTIICKFEENFFEELSDLLGFPGPYPHTNGSKRSVQEDELSEDVRERVLKLYAQDFEELGYH